VLYNNAGIFPADDGGTLETPEATWDRVMEVNLKGVWLGCRAGIPAMLESGGGSIINVASFVALVGAATAQIAYTSSKGGVLAMTREMAVEYGTLGHPRQLVVSGPHRDPAPRRAHVGSGAPPAATRAHPDGPARPGIRTGEGRAIPCVGRLVVHDRIGVGRRRWYYRRVRDSRVTHARESRQRSETRRARSVCQMITSFPHDGVS